MSDLIVGMDFDARGDLIIADAYCGLLRLSEGKPAKVISEVCGDVSALALTKDRKKAYVASNHSIVLVDLKE